MLAVSPPLHQDFRGAHARFCSPGDGWPAFIPPPPPTVQPAFHFCSVLLDPEAYAPRYNPWIKQPKPKAPFDERLRGACQGALRLPAEVLDQVWRYTIADGVSGPSLIRSSRWLRESTLPHVYRDVRLKTLESVERFAQCLDAHPERAAFVRQLHIETHRVNWDTMQRIARHLSNASVGSALSSEDAVRKADRVESLTIGIQASDLRLAGEFLSFFSPRQFRWHTSPCWLMRPAQLYCDFLSKWTRLEAISLEGFRFDAVLAECLQVVPSLRRVTLAGKGCQHLDAATLRAVLGQDEHVDCVKGTAALGENRMFRTAASASLAYRISIADCPQDRRDLLLMELLSAQDRCDSMDESIFPPRFDVSERLTWI